MDQEIHGVLLWLTIAGAAAGLVYWWLWRRKKNRSRSL
jgi:LPXTG-motif cell wall-anchored protein